MTPRLRRLAPDILVGAILLAAFALGVAVLSGDGGGDAVPARTPAPAEGGSYLARFVPGRAAETEAGGRDADRLRRLSLEEKAGQVVLAGFSGAGAEAPIVGRQRQEGFGALALEDAGELGALGVAALSTAVCGGRSAADAPLLFASQEGGSLSAIPELPPERLPGRTASVGEAARAAARSARALRDLGVDGVLGPVVDVGPEDGGALGARTYSDDPQAVAALARRAVRAYRRAGLLSAPKHFPGLGAASGSTAEGPATVGLSIDQLRDRDLLPFRAAVRADAPAIVVGHGTYGTDDFVTPASQSPFIIRDLLRRELDFEGLVISDDLSAGAITTYGPVAAAAVTSLRAGVDLVHVSGPAREQAEVRRAIARAVRDRRLPETRLDEAVGRVLAAKRRLQAIR